jgi:L-proline---[L-prolyl-carrier protein] ligase
VNANTIHGMLQRSSELYPNRTAVGDDSGSLNYFDLATKANRLANLLIEAGVSLGDRVGLDVPKSLDAVVGLYGTLQAGGCYVPFDPQVPAVRVEHIVRDCDIKCVLTTAIGAPKWLKPGALGSTVTTLVILDKPLTLSSEKPELALSIFGSDSVNAQSSTPPGRHVDIDNLAYILYTSGSTGTPKGVMLSHRNALAFVEWAAREFGLTPDDRMASHAPLQFDLSVFDLFAAGLSGAAVVLVPPWLNTLPGELASLIERERISVWYSVPSALVALARHGNLVARDLHRLRTVLFAGEVFPIPHLRNLMALLPHTRFANLYGPTETNVCTWFDVEPLSADHTEPVPIGRPITGVEVTVVDDVGNPAPSGSVGELYVQGPTVMRGYWGDEERTQRALVPSPLADDLLAYSTGDLVRLGSDGNLRLLGRRDHQVKSRGYRIELGEVEATLYSDPTVTSAVVLAIPDPQITNRLVACVVTNSPPDRTRLARVCADRLPRYMCPESFVFLEALPSTSTGKVDRTALMRQLSHSVTLPTPASMDERTRT